MKAITVLLVVITLTLSGCATIEPRRVYVPGPEVKIEVAKKCLLSSELPQPPIWPLESPLLKEGADNLTALIVRAAEAERILRRAYVQMVSTLLKRCAE